MACQVCFLFVPSLADRTLMFAAQPMNLQGNHFSGNDQWEQSSIKMKTYILGKVQFNS